MKLGLFFLFLLPISMMLALNPAHGQIQYDYTVLQTKDAVEMQELITRSYKGLEAEMSDSNFDPRAYGGEFVAALRVAMSRPDFDSARATAFGPTRRLLLELEFLNSTIDLLVTEAITQIHDPKTSPMDRTTYMIVLENLIHEFKPDLAKNSAIRKSIARIAEANITIDPKTRNFQLLRSMKVMQSPSDLAKSVLAKIKPVAPMKSNAPKLEIKESQRSEFDFQDDTMLKSMEPAKNSQIKRKKQKK